MFESLTDLKGAHVNETSQPVNYWSWQKYLSPARNLLDRKGSSQHADRRRFAAVLPQKRSQLVIDIPLAVTELHPWRPILKGLLVMTKRAGLGNFVGSPITAAETKNRWFLCAAMYFGLDLVYGRFERQMRFA
jgi:hypothetical protein